MKHERQNVDGTSSVKHTDDSLYRSVYFEKNTLTKLKK